MYRLELDINDDVLIAIQKIAEINDHDIDVVLPEGAVLLENILNLKLLISQAEKSEKSLTFQTVDETGQNLISILDEDTNTTTFSGFPTEEQELTLPSESRIEIPRERNKLSKLKMPKISVPSINLKGKGIIFGIIALVILVGILYKVSKMPIATVGISVNTQSFAKSVQLKVDKSVLTNAENKTVNGTNVTTLLTETLSIDTTGQKVVGKKAIGTVKIYNRTDSDKTFNKGAVLTFEKNNKTYNYVLDKGVVVEAATLADPADPASNSVPGSAEADFTAEEVGEVYNIDKNESLDVKGQKSSQFTAQTSSKIEGGSSKTVKVVAQADIDKITADLTKAITDKTADALKSKTTSDQKLIQGSTKVAPLDIQVSKKLGDETDKLDATATTTVTGLVYLQSDLNRLIDKMTESFIPDGYKLSDKEKDIKVEVLGNTETTVLSQERADIQVTVKALVVPNITEESIQNELKGKGVKDAEDTLAQIKNIKTYSISINPSIPLLKKIPNDMKRIKVNIEID
jgi:hypothetical protein